MEWAIILHLFTGLYMISNPDIFNFNDSEKIKSKFLRLYAAQISLWFNKIFGVESTRLEQLHTIVYLIGIFVFLVCFILERVFSLFSKGINAMCCCIRQQMVHEKEVFSCNFLAELSAQDLKHEYDMTKLRIDEHASTLTKLIAKY